MHTPPIIERDYADVTEELAWLELRSQLLNHHYACPQVTLEGVTRIWLWLPYPLNKKICCPIPTQNLTGIVLLMIYLQSKTKIVKIGSSVPSVSRLMPLLCTFLELRQFHVRVYYKVRSYILIYYICNAHFHWLWRSRHLTFMQWKQRRRHESTCYEKAWDWPNKNRNFTVQN